MASGCSVFFKDGRSGLSRVEIRIPWTVEEFTDMASRCVHPSDRTIKVPPALANAMATIARLGPHKLKQKREDTIAHWTKRKAELELQETTFKKQLNPDVAKVIGNKAVLLFSEMLQALYSDMGVVELLTMGIKVAKFHAPPKPEPNIKGYGIRKFRGDWNLVT